VNTGGRTKEDKKEKHTYSYRRELDMCTAQKQLSVNRFMQQKLLGSQTHGNCSVQHFYLNWWIFMFLLAFPQTNPLNLINQNWINDIQKCSSLSLDEVHSPLVVRLAKVHEVEPTTYIPYWPIGSEPTFPQWDANVTGYLRLKSTFRRVL
jgi:hypothetical protein